MMSSGINLVMTVIGFAVSIMFIVFVCTRLVCARIQLNRTRSSTMPLSSSSSIAAAAHGSHHHHQLSTLERGLPVTSTTSASNFPTKKFSDHYFSSLQDAQCTVCLAEYQPEDVLRILPFCGHSFHATCIDIWLQQHATCPICRVSLRDLPDKDKKRWMRPMFSSVIPSNHNTYTPESLAMQSYHCLLTGHAYSYRHTLNNPSQETCGMDPIQEDLSDVTEETNTPPQVMHSIATNKHVESPSNQ